MATGKSRQISKAVAVALIAMSACLPVNGVPAVSGRGALPRLALDVPALRDGDIVLRRGLDMMSRLVLTQGDAARFSHVGLIVMRRDIPYVIHAMPEEGGHRGGAVLESFRSFIAPSEASEVAVYRRIGLSKAQRAAIKQSAFSQLGLPFDDRFQLSDTQKVYCTELVMRAYADAGLVLVDARAKIQVPLLPEAVVPPDHLRRFPAVPLRVILSASS
jgi:uncharacterized protein YycO